MLSSPDRRGVAGIARTGSDRAWARRARALGLTVLFAAFAAAMAGGPARADAVKGTASLTKEDNFARLVVHLKEDVESDVRTAGSILIIRFKRPVDVPVTRLPDQLPDYVSSARKDPDGTALRLALSRKVKVNAMSAGERLFVDLLPENWSGPPPGLPTEVVQELAERARNAEKMLRQRKQEEARKEAPIRVRASTMPTFVRYVFELPDGVGVSSDLGRDKLALVFNAALNFDLADAKVVAPSNIASIEQRNEPEKTTVEIGLIGEVNVHSFREEKNLIVDVGVQGADRGAELSRMLPNDELRLMKSRQSPSRAAEEAAAPAPAAPPVKKPSSAAPAKAETAAAPTPPPSANRDREVESRIAASVPAAVAPPPLPLDQLERAAPPPAWAAKPASVPADPRPDAPTGTKPKEMAAEEAKVPSKDAPKDTAKDQVDEPAKESAKETAKETTREPAKETAKELAKETAGDRPAAKSAEPAKEQAKDSHRDQARTSDPGAAKRSGEKPAAEAAGQAPRAATAPTVIAEVREESGGLKISFPFSAPTAAAAFLRADSVWLVFDAKATINLDAVIASPQARARGASQLALDNATAVRIQLERPRLAGLSLAGNTWTLALGETIQAPSQQLSVTRNIADMARASVMIPFEQPASQHRLVDPDAGNVLIVVTASAPTRGFIRGQKFVEFRLPETIHGIVVDPLSDDIGVELAPDKVSIGRPGGLTLSAAEMAPERAAAPMRPVLDNDVWKRNRAANFIDHLQELQRQVAEAPEQSRPAARLDLARFYLARELNHEAKAVLDIAVAELKAGSEDASVLVLRGIANILSGYVAEGLKDFAHPVVGGNFDSHLWKAIAAARQGKWAEAREKFKNVEFSISALPLELQRVAVTDSLRAALEVNDYASAANRLNEIEVVGSVGGGKAALAVLRGRLAEALGRDADALVEYGEAMKSGNRAAEVEGRLRDVVLRLRRDEIKSAEALEALETIAVTWRGDMLEVETLRHLSRLYANEGKYRDALVAVKTATRIAPNSAFAREMQDDATKWFGEVFLGDKGDDLPPVETLAMFYEFRELTPIGRRGDEMVRRLADRLAAVDLLDQACELLQYQIDHRLEGAARAQVAGRLAMFYLMNRKPERAIAALRASRIVELAGELRQQRLLLEARAQSDLGRHDLALDIVANVGGREAIRLRSDIYWASKRWRDSAEQIELMYGERWRDFQPLTALEKSDILRAGIGYALAEDVIGIERLREKYAPKMTGEADRAAFDLATKAVAATSAEFAQIAKLAASVDTLEGFLRAMKERFPDATARAPLPPATKSDPTSTGSLPPIPGLRQLRP